MPDPAERSRTVRLASTSPCTRQRGNAGARVNRHATPLFAASLAFTGVDAGANSNDPRDPDRAGRRSAGPGTGTHSSDAQRSGRPGWDWFWDVNRRTARRRHLPCVDFARLPPDWAVNTNQRSTWSYMAPERFQGGTADARADIYALSCGVELATPVSVAASTEQFGGADDVGEQHRLDHSFVDCEDPLCRRRGMAEPTGCRPTVECGPGSVLTLGRSPGMGRPSRQRRRWVRPPRPPRSTTLPPKWARGTGMPRTSISSDVDLHTATSAAMVGLEAQSVDRGAGGAARRGRRWRCVLLRNVLSPKATGPELVLTATTDPGANAFMPPQPRRRRPAPNPHPPCSHTAAELLWPPSRCPATATACMAAPQDAECERDKMINFLAATPPRPAPSSRHSTPTPPCTGAADTPSPPPTSPPTCANSPRALRLHPSHNHCSTVHPQT